MVQGPRGGLLSRRSPDFAFQTTAQSSLMHRIQRPHLAFFSIFAAILLLPVCSARGQGLSDIRITEISESGQWFELKNTANGSVDISAAELCANINYAEAEELTVEAYDDTGNQDLTLAAGEYIALQWNEIDADNGDFGVYEAGTSNFADPDNIIDYVRWGPDESQADRQDVAVGAGIWTDGDFVEAAQEGGTIAFLGDDAAANDDPADWDEGNPTPAAGNVILPVELTSFDVVLDGTAAVLTWTTASETTNAGFAVQHRTDGAFERVGYRDGAGTTTEAQHYRFRLPGLSAGTHAFRLKQVDLDGSVEFSPTVEVTVRTRTVSSLRPNPTTGTARFQLSVRRDQAVAVDLYDALGRHVRTVFDGAMASGRTRDIAVGGAALSSGVYLVRIAGERFVTTRRFVVVE